LAFKRHVHVSQSAEFCNEYVERRIADQREKRCKTIFGRPRPPRTGLEAPRPENYNTGSAQRWITTATVQ